MKTRAIGTLDVTVVGIGCTNFGRELDAAATEAIVDAALDAGITFFDTADSYGKPATTSETLLGAALKGRRDSVVIATKFGRALDETRRGAKPAYVRAATEASLKRLQTDRIDLLQLHIPDPETPIADTLGALQALIAEGKVREIGASNFSAAQLREAEQVAQQQGLPRFVSTQAELSILHRDPVADLIAECAASDVKLLPFRPLFYGLLTGKYRPDAPLPAGTKIGDTNAARQAMIMSAANLAIVSALTRYAEARGHTMLELAFAWLLSHAIVPSVIAGVSSARQVASNAKAANWALTPTELAEVEALIATPM